jgi:dihydropteroate synthase
VNEAEELRRVLPVIEALAPRVRVSVDTTKAAVAQAAISAGATLLNDVSATLWPVAAAAGAGWVAMHMQGSPRTMQQHPHYGDVVAEVRDFLVQRAQTAADAGVPEVWIDPGIGFGKRLPHNLALLARLDELCAVAADRGFGVMVGTSRKSFLGKLAPGTDGTPVAVADRLPGSLATATWAMLAGADMVRAHDVAPTVQAATLVPERDRLTMHDTRKAAGR